MCTKEFHLIDPPDSSEPIFFLGHPLPLGTYWLEVLGPILQSTPAALSSRVREWLLDLHYCAGIVRSARSEQVIEMAAAVRAVLASHQPFILEELGSWGFSDATRLYSDWLCALDIMDRLARTQENSEWTRAGYVDPEATRKWKVFLEMHDPENE